MDVLILNPHRRRCALGPVPLRARLLRNQLARLEAHRISHGVQLEFCTQHEMVGRELRVWKTFRLYLLWSWDGPDCHRAYEVSRVPECVRNGEWVDW